MSDIFLKSWDLYACQNCTNCLFLYNVVTVEYSCNAFVLDTRADIKVATIKLS